MATWVVTGANRGIGLEITRQVAARGDHVFAACRSPSKELEGIGLGFTLPFFYPLAIFLGAVFAEVAKYVNKAWAERYVVTIAAGGIAGESIVGVIVQALNNFVLH